MTGNRVGSAEYLVLDRNFAGVDLSNVESAAAGPVSLPGRRRVSAVGLSVRVPGLSNCDTKQKKERALQANELRTAA